MGFFGKSDKKSSNDADTSSNPISSTQETGAAAAGTGQQQPKRNSFRKASSFSFSRSSSSSSSSTPTLSLKHEHTPKSFFRPISLKKKVSGGVEKGQEQGKKQPVSCSFPESQQEGVQSTPLPPTPTEHVADSSSTTSTSNEKIAPVPVVGQEEGEMLTETKSTSSENEVEHPTAAVEEEEKPLDEGEEGTTKAGAVEGEGGREEGAAGKEEQEGVKEGEGIEKAVVGEGGEQEELKKRSLKDGAINPAGETDELSLPSLSHSDDHFLVNHEGVVGGLLEKASAAAVVAKEEEEERESLPSSTSSSSATASRDPAAAAAATVEEGKPTPIPATVEEEPSSLSATDSASTDNPHSSAGPQRRIVGRKTAELWQSVHSTFAETERRRQEAIQRKRASTYHEISAARRSTPSPTSLFEGGKSVVREGSAEGDGRSPFMADEKKEVYNEILNMRGAGTIQQIMLKFRGTSRIETNEMAQSRLRSEEKKALKARTEALAVHHFKGLDHFEFLKKLKYASNKKDKEVFMQAWAKDRTLIGHSLYLDEGIRFLQDLGMRPVRISEEKHEGEERQYNDDLYSALTAVPHFGYCIPAEAPATYDPENEWKDWMEVLKEAVIAHGGSLEPSPAAAAAAAAAVVPTDLPLVMPLPPVPSIKRPISSSTTTTTASSSSSTSPDRKNTSTSPPRGNNGFPSSFHFSLSTSKEGVAAEEEGEGEDVVSAAASSSDGLKEEVRTAAAVAKSIGLTVNISNSNSTSSSSDGGVNTLTQGNTSSSCILPSATAAAAAATPTSAFPSSSPSASEGRRSRNSSPRGVPLHVLQHVKKVGYWVSDSVNDVLIPLAPPTP